MNPATASFLPLFLSSSRANIENFKKNISILLSNPTDEAAQYEAFRFMHSMRGESNLMGFPQIESFSAKAAELLKATHASKELFQFLQDRSAKLLESLTSIEQSGQELDLSSEVQMLQKFDKAVV